MDEKVDYFKILEEKLEQKSRIFLGALLVGFVFLSATTLYALIISASLFEIVLNVLSIIFLGQFLLMLLRVIRAKKGTKS